MENNYSRLFRLQQRLDQLESIGQLQTFPSNHLLIKAESQSEKCFIVKSGSVAAFKQTSSGEELIFFIMEANSIFAEGMTLFDRLSPVSFKTTSPSSLVVIKKEPLLKAVKNDSQLLFTLLEVASLKFYTAMDEVSRVKLQNVPSRVCDLLADFAVRYGVSYDGKIMINHKVSIQLLTSMLGVNRASVVRAIKSLKDINLLEYINGYYCLRSLEKLMQHKELIDSE
ncbi:MAG: Crp/Fnr family transcriptional regulator [Deltaproteobacteria bacterium]|nr:Crp/Fnr family transcriptional regulator [Deltaproteobacteria bacterium]